MDSCVSPVSFQGAYVEIVEQPASAGVRFRYKCEGRSAGCIRGIRSSEKIKTFPSIKVNCYKGSAACVVSCVTKEGPPYYPHPHNLVGKNTSGNGVCYRPFNSDDMTCNFPNLGIQCVKKKDIKESLMHRQRLQVDPFGTGFSHMNQNHQIHQINLNTVRLCFQVFIADSCGKLSIPLKPVISEPIFDNKAVSDLTISRLSHSSTSVIGGQEIILLCDQVNRDDIEVVFYEVKDDNVIWSSQGCFAPHHVHRKAAICLITPPYRITCISQPVDVYIQLRRPSDGAVGKPRCFTYMPLIHDPDGMLRKKQKFDALRLETRLQTVRAEDEVLRPRTIKKAVRNSKIKGTSDSPAEYSNNESGSQQFSIRPHEFLYAERTFSQRHYAAYGLPRSRAYQNEESTGDTYENQNIRPMFANQSNGGDDILALASQQTCISRPNYEAIFNEVGGSMERFGSLDLNFESFNVEANLNDVSFESFLDMSTFNHSVRSDVKCTYDQ